MKNSGYNVSFEKPMTCMPKPEYLCDIDYDNEIFIEVTNP